MTHPFDELHALVADAYRHDDAVRYKLHAWVEKHDPRPKAERPNVMAVRPNYNPEPNMGG